MKIKFSKSFAQRLNDQVDYIANDKPSAARKFKTEIIARIKQIPQVPYGNRKSIFFDRNYICIIFSSSKLSFCFCPVSANVLIKS